MIVPAILRLPNRSGPQFVRWHDGTQAAASAISVALEAELDGAGVGWTDISVDVRLGEAPVVAEYGIRGTGPLDRVASTGTLTFALDNTVSNSGWKQGYYSPGHANARTGFELGIVVRLAIIDNATGARHYKFRGTLISVQPDAGLKRRQAVSCTVVDWIDEAARAKIRDVNTQTDKRSDQIIDTLITTAVTRQPVTKSLRVGQGEFPFALDNMQDNSTPVLRAIADCVMSELGYFYVKGDTSEGGTAVFEDRHKRVLDGAAEATFNDTMLDVDAVRTRDDIINRVHVIVHPRKIDAAATTVLYELTPTETVPSVVAGGTIALHGLYRDATGRFIRLGGSEQVTPASTTDYTANAAADGSGADLTASVAVTAAFSSNGVTFTITNNHASATAYITKLQVRGKGVYDTYETMVEAQHASSQTTYGESAVVIDLPYEDDVNIAQGVADQQLQVYKDPRYTVRAVTVSGQKSAALMTQCLAREPGDKIAIVETVTGLTNTASDGTEFAYYIQQVRFEIRVASKVYATWTLAPTIQSQSGAWILERTGFSELGETTYLGYV